jgi:MFS family permease
MARPGLWQARLPFYFGWVVVAVAFVTMAVGVSARTAFSLLMPPLLTEFGWDRGLAAGAFSFGFLVSAVLGPFAGRAMDRNGPRVVIGIGIAMTGSGMLLAPFIAQAWHLYAALGVLVGAGANLLGYTAQSLYLPNWFVRRRGFAVGIAFSGVGVGAIVLLPLFQHVITVHGWRTACLCMGVLTIILLAPINLLIRRHPADLGLEPDGAPSSPDASKRQAADIVDAAWAGTEWTLAKAVRTARFWWLCCGFSAALFAWYAVQVHQTKYLVEIGFTVGTAAWALGWVSVCAIPGQIGLGALSDRIGREPVWALGCGGFAICYAALIALEGHPSAPLLALMVFAQGFLGYSITSVMGPMVAEIFGGPHFGSIFGAMTVALILGGAAGPWVAGTLHDLTGSYRPGFALAMLLCALSAVAIWRAAPRKVRRVPMRHAGQ